MAVQLRPGVFEELFAEVAAEGVKRAQTATKAMTYFCERQAKINVSNGSHEYGTPTPASPGEGPAVISGTLRRSIISTPVVAVAGGWAGMVGPRPGLYPWYSGKVKRHYKPNPKPPADSAKYGYYLETGDWGKTYPWLWPALHMVEILSGPALMREIFGAPWPTFG